MMETLMPFLVGSVGVGIGAFFWWRTQKLRKECTAQTAGVVIDKDHYKKRNNGKREDRYRPTFTYSVEGVEYTKQTPYVASEAFPRDKAWPSSTIPPNRNGIIFWKKED